MTTLYAGDDASYPVTIPIPEDGEDCAEAFTAPAWRKLADRAAYLKKRAPVLYSYAASASTYWTYADAPNQETTVSVDGLIDIDGAVVGDKIAVECFLCYTRGANNPKTFTACLLAIDDVEDTAVETEIDGTHYSISGDLIGDGTVVPLSLCGVWTVATAGKTRITFAFTSAADTFAIKTSFSLIAMRFGQ